MMTKLKVTVRIEKHNGKPALFYYDDRKQLTCYSHDEGHCLAARAYMYADTLPVKLNSAKWLDAVKRFGEDYYYKERISIDDNIDK